MPAPRQAKVLLVDDRKDNLTALEATLQGLSLSTAAATSGEGALKKLLVEDYAVILMDAQMPGMDGFETAQHIKRRERTRHTPIIFLTAADDDSYLAYRSYAAGAVDYLTKPLDPWQLRAKVSIFVDLWDRKEKLNVEAARMRAVEIERDRLRSGVEEAAAALKSADPEKPGPALERALGALEQVRTAAG